MTRYLKNILQTLIDEYPDAACTLDYENPLQLMVATQLAAQCTDARVNIVMQTLAVKYPNVQAYSAADLSELMNDIHSTGFFRNKAKNIIGAAKRIISDYGGEVPDSMEALLTLPGVGRKTANLLLTDAFGQTGIVVDTHAGRLSRRMGLTKNTDPYKVELDLLKIIPPEQQCGFCHRLVLHGRKYCKSQRPDCKGCPLRSSCKKVGLV